MSRALLARGGDRKIRGPAHSAPPSQGRLRGLSGTWRTLLLMAGLVGAGAVLRWGPIKADPALLDRFATAGGPGRDVVFILAAAAACAVGLPRQAAAFAAGYAFGAAAGTASAMAAQMLGCLAAYAWARALGRDWAARRMPARMRRVHDLLLRRPFAATLTLRLLPVGNNLLLNLAAGLAGVPAGRFLAASFVGYLPQTIVFALLGEGTDLGAGTKLAVGAGLFACSAVLGAVLARAGRAAEV